MNEIIENIRIERVSNGYIVYPNFRLEPAIAYSTSERLVFETVENLNEYLEKEFNLI